jgi:hypothetical protein
MAYKTMTHHLHPFSSDFSSDFFIAVTANSAVLTLFIIDVYTC